MTILSPVFAKHITGGEMIYDYLGPGTAANSKKYRITLRLFRDDNCVGCSAMPVGATIAIYNNDNNTNITGFQEIGRTNLITLPLNPLPPCITNTPILNYSAGYYTFEYDLPDNNNGYTATYQTCCRVTGITNGGGDEGATYTTDIPGNNILKNGMTDNSARFETGISVICFNKSFTLDFSAKDPDAQDSLVYTLCDAFAAPNARDASYATPAPTPYSSINYRQPFSSSFPLGTLATINASTGIISGIAPDAGKYVVSVCVQSYRNGILINTHRKDFIVTVADCDLPGAKLVTPYYINCDSSTVHFTDLVVSPLNLTFDWNFGDPASGANNFSTTPDAVHTYTDTGIFYVKLVVNKGSPCADSAISPVRIYPGFSPAFKQNSPMCKGIPVQFTDLTSTAYGTVNKWSWDFGVSGINTDVSTIKNPTYAYANAGTYNSTLIVSTNNGCIATLNQPVTIQDRPTFDIAPHDTLICTIDTLKLVATAGAPGSIIWTPNYNINNVNSFTPFVSPDVTTTYKVQFTDTYGCVAKDSVKVNVVSQVSLQAAPDTAICRTDSVTLKLNTDALYFTWTPAATLQNPSVKNPTALPVNPSTTYHVVASISNKCFKTANITVRTVPYPVAMAGKDTSVCFGESASLHASGGSIYSWSPVTFLTDPNISNPVSFKPTGNISYIVTVRDTLGCPKPKTDTMLVTVIRIHADAGPRDTSVVINQPLQLNATGSINYLWTPPTWLSNPNISNPVSLPKENIVYAVKVSDAQGCFDLDTINVRLFKVAPDLYVPTAFSPDGDGINDIFRPIALGIRSLELFSVYNRWGQLVYSTTQIGQGWNGKFNAADQPAGTFVWYAEATDYLGKKIKKKGSVILIR
ncbi:MAG: PKD domain-containing protein [Ferruginibacter sp.]